MAKYVTVEDGKAIAKDLMEHPLPFNKFNGNDVRTVVQNDKGLLVKFNDKPATPDEVKYSLHKSWLASNPFYPSSQRFVEAALKTFAGSVVNRKMNNAIKTIKQLYVKTCKIQDNVTLANNNKIPFTNMCESLLKRFNEYVGEKKKAAQVILNVIYNLNPFAPSYVMEDNEQRIDKIIDECVHKTIQEHIK